MANLLRKSIIIYIAVFGISHTNLCEAQNLIFDRFLVEDGLTSINAITDDENGFKWIGGTHGLYRFDGYEFKVFTHNPADSGSMCGNNVLTLYHDDAGYMWVGTVGSGLSKYDPETERFYSISELSNHTITCIHRDHQGILWIGTLGDGIFLFGPDDKLLDHYQSQPEDSSTLSNNQVFDVYEDNIGRIWVTTNSGSIDLFHRNSKIFEPFYYSRKPYTSVRSGQKIYRDHQGYFWIGTEGDGLYKFDEKDKSFQHYIHQSDNPNSISNNIIMGMAEGVPGELWIATDGGGLNLLNTRTLSFEHFEHDPQDEFSLINNSSYSLFIDKNLVLWLGMGDGVVNVSRRSMFKTYLPSISDKNSLSFRVVVTLCLASDKKLWIGTGGGGIDMFDIDKGEFSNYSYNPDNPNSLSTNIILSLEEDKNGHIWAGTFLGGVDRIDTKSKRIRNFSNDPNNPASLINDHIFDIEEDVEGNIWIATMGGGLDMFDPKKEIFTHHQFERDNPLSIKSDRVLSLCEDSKNVLWIGSYDGGLQIYDEKSQSFVHYGQDEDAIELLKNNPIHDIIEDSDGAIWFGTGESGLGRLKPELNEMTVFTIQDGLPSNSVYGVFEDREKKIWACTNKGLFRYDPGNESMVVLNSDDGLPTNDFEAGSIVQTEDGDFYVSSKKGLVSFNPGEIKQNTEAVKVTLTGFRIFNELVNPGQTVENYVPIERAIAYSEEIYLPYYLNNIAFDFAAPGYQNPAKIRYRYQLEGEDERWLETDSRRRTASFSNLSPGDYVFKIMAANSADLWSSELTQVKVHISPPFWRTIWAYLLYVLIGSSLVYYLIMEYTRRLRLKNQLDLEKYKHEKDNELNLLKIGFFTNISHELRTPVTLILGPLERLVNTYNQDNRIRHQLMVMQRNGLRLLQLINQLLDFRKVESGKMHLLVHESDVVAFIREIILSFQALAHQKQIDFSVSPESESIVAYIDKSKLEIIIYNLLSNAFKFTREHGSIRISVARIKEDNNEWIRIDVEDSGIGINEKVLPYIFEMFYQEKEHIGSQGSGIGLALCKNLVELHHGKIQVDSEYNKGSCFSVWIPAKRSSYQDHEIGHIPIEDAKYEEVKTQFIENHNREEVSKEKLPLMLVVEDNLDLNAFLCESFEKKYNVINGKDGEEGYKLAIENLPDIIISDVMMPAMDGVELCSKLKLDFRTSHIPVILLTARNAEIYQLEGLENGADDYITKPFSFKLLDVRAANLVESRRKLQERFTREAILRPKEIATNNPDEQFLQKLNDLIEDHISDPELSVVFLAREIGMSHSVLYRKLVALTGRTVNDFIRKYRLQRAAQLLKKGDYSINEIGYITGFSNPKYFSTSFKKEFGATPTDYKNEQQM